MWDTRTAIRGFRSRQTISGFCHIASLLVQKGFTNQKQDHPDQLLSLYLDHDDAKVRLFNSLELFVILWASTAQYEKSPEICSHVCLITNYLGSPSPQALFDEEWQTPNTQRGIL